MSARAGLAMSSPARRDALDGGRPALVVEEPLAASAEARVGVEVAA